MTTITIEAASLHVGDRVDSHDDLPHVVERIDDDGRGMIRAYIDRTTNAYWTAWPREYPVRIVVS